MRYYCKQKEQRRQRIYEKALDTVATSPFARAVQTWVLAGERLSAQANGRASRLRDGMACWAGGRPRRAPEVVEGCAVGGCVQALCCMEAVAGLAWLGAGQARHGRLHCSTAALLLMGGLGSAAGAGVGPCQRWVR